MAENETPPKHSPSTSFCSGLLSRRLLGLSPENLLALMAAVIFLAEVIDMLLINLLPEMPSLWEALLDASILIVIISPVYFCIYRPFWERHQHAEEDIQRLSRQLIRAEEMTRKELARDLHDEFGQALTALQLGIDTLRHSHPHEQQKLNDMCDRLGSLTAQLGNHVRSVTTKLHPTILDNLGLVPTLRWHLRQFEQLYPGIRIEVDIADNNRRLHPEVEVALYRIVQESLNNVAKHSRAGRVYLTYGHRGGRQELAVRDNGIGFDVDAWYATTTTHRGIGLLGMRERCADLGGTFEVTSSPGKGTSVRVTMPPWTEEAA